MRPLEVALWLLVAWSQPALPFQVQVAWWALVAVPSQQEGLPLQLVAWLGAPLALVVTWDLGAGQPGQLQAATPWVLQLRLAQALSQAWAERLGAGRHGVLGVLVKL